jgi:hypothetical protein
VQHLTQYNTAVALVQQEQFASASNILESLFRRIEPCDEWVAMRAAFLLLDIYARAFPGTDTEDNNLSMVTGKARAVLQYLEQPHVFTDASAAAACLSIVLPSSVAASPGGGSSTYVAAAGRAVVQHFQGPLAVHRARFALAEGALSTAMQYLKQAFDTLGGASGKSAGQEHVPFLAVLPQLDGLDLGGISVAATSKGSLTVPGWVPLHSTRQMALTLRAEVALRRRHFQRACRILQYAIGESETVARKLPSVAGDRGLSMAQYLNNLGVVQAMAGKPASAVLLLSKAVDAALAHNVTHGLTPAMSHAARSPAGGSAAGAGGKRGGGRKGGSSGTSEGGFPERNPPSNKRKPAPHSSLAAGGGVTPPRVAPMGDILANLGLALLLSRQPARALTALHGAAPSRRHQPRLWLRMAEACLQAHAMRTSSGPGHAHAMPVVPTDGAGATTVAAGPTEPSPDAFATDGGDDGRDDNVGDGGAEICWAGVGLVSTKLGGGAQQRLLLSCARADTEPPAALPPVGVRTEADSADICSVRPQLNLSYAVTCLLNCVALLPHPATVSTHMTNTLNQAQKDITAAVEEHSAAQERGGNATQRVMVAQTTGRAAAMRCLRWGQCRVRQAALCKLAYAALCRGDPHTAISACQQVWSIAHLLQPALNSAQLIALHTASVPSDAAQSIQSLADPWRFLAYSYMCEALCTLGRVRDGMQYLARAVPPVDGPQQAQSVSIPTGPPQNGTAAPGEPLFPAHTRVPLAVPSAVPRVGAVSAMYTNVAIAHILTGEHDTAATSAAQALAAMPSCVYARGLSAYLSLRRAAFGEAAALVNRGLVHSRPAAAPGAVAPGSSG